MPWKRLYTSSPSSGRAHARAEQGMSTSCTLRPYSLSPAERAVLKQEEGRVSEREGAEPVGACCSVWCSLSSTAGL